MKDVEKKLPIQESSNEIDLKIFFQKNINAIAVVILCLANICFSVFTITGEGIVLRELPYTVIGWLLWVIFILLPPTIGIIVMETLRSDGIKKGHQDIKVIHDEYLNLLHNNETFVPRSLKTYISQNLKKNIIQKYIIAIITSFLLVQGAIAMNLNNLLSVFVNTIMFVAFGLIELNKARLYVNEELSVWYKIEIKKIKEKIQWQMQSQLKEENSEPSKTQPNG